MSKSLTVNELFETLDELLTDKQYNAMDFMYMGSSNVDGIAQHSFKHINTRDYLYMYYDGEKYTVAIPMTDTPFNRGQFTSQEGI